MKIQSVTVHIAYSSGASRVRARARVLCVRAGCVHPDCDFGGRGRNDRPRPHPEINKRSMGQSQ
jgi:hypothetical protein